MELQHSKRRVVVQFKLLDAEQIADWAYVERDIRLTPIQIQYIDYLIHGEAITDMPMASGKTFALSTLVDYLESLPNPLYRK